VDKGFGVRAATEHPDAIVGVLLMDRTGQDQGQGKDRVRIGSGNKDKDRVRE
jgi:hypothetical protein